jgi:hypothetical protein
MRIDDIVKIQEIALADHLSPDISHLYRKICRSYSATFHTPLHLVYSLPPSQVIRDHYEHFLDQIKDEEVLDSLIFRALNPNTDEDEEEEIQDFISMIEQEEEEKQKAKTLKEQESLDQMPSNGTVSKSYDLPEEQELAKESGKIDPLAEILGFGSDDTESPNDG